MPIEGLPTEPANNSAVTQNTSDATDKNTDVSNTGTATDSAQQNPGTQQDVTETPEFKAALTAAIKDKIPQLKRQVAREFTGEKDGGVTLEELQRQLSERDAKLRAYEAKDEVQKFISNGQNKLNVDPKNIRGIEALVIPQLEYDDNGKPSNLREAFESAKVIAPALFVNSTSNINAHSGNGNATRPGNMNDWIRQQAGIG
jgi:hypothetical protein